MGKVEMVALLQADNPRKGLMDLGIYADAYLLYLEAQGNISRNGAIVVHPRTGAPIDNPYLRVMRSAQAVMAKAGRVKCGRLMDALANEPAPENK